MKRLLMLPSEIINHPMTSHEFCELIQQTKGMTGFDMLEWLPKLTIDELKGLKKCSAYLLDSVDEELSKRE